MHAMAERDYKLSVKKSQLVISCIMAIETEVGLRQRQTLTKDFWRFFE